jgi:hypothetical protein
LALRTFVHRPWGWEQPLHVATQVVNNIPQVRFSSAIGDPDIYLREDMTDGVSMTDWLIKYANGTTIDISQLINDDYFLAIKLTFNAKLYVSSMKLLLSAIDSIAYIEYGDKKDIFEKWLTTYADISHLGITPKELWEMRNGLLHMTNLNSREVSKKRCVRYPSPSAPRISMSVMASTISASMASSKPTVPRW